MSDQTDQIRQQLVSEINVGAARLELERQHGEVWDTNQLSQTFEVLSFLAPFVVVRRKCDGTRGSLIFQHSPRLYFDFTEDR